MASFTGSLLKVSMLAYSTWTFINTYERVNQSFHTQLNRHAHIIVGMGGAYPSYYNLPTNGHCLCIVDQTSMLILHGLFSKIQLGLH